MKFDTIVTSAPLAVASFSDAVDLVIVAVNQGHHRREWFGSRRSASSKSLAITTAAILDHAGGHPLGSGFGAGGESSPRLEAKTSRGLRTTGGQFVDGSDLGQALAVPLSRLWTGDIPACW